MLENEKLPNKPFFALSLLMRAGRQAGHSEIKTGLKQFRKEARQKGGRTLAVQERVYTVQCTRTVCRTGS